MQVIYIRNTIAAASVVIKASIAAVLAFYVLALIPGVYSFLAVTPGYLLPPSFKIWTLLTGIITERSILNVLVDIPVLVICGTHLEPVWGALELLKFMLITGVGSILSTSLLSVCFYAVSWNWQFVFVEFSGMAAVLGGVTVAIKQICPDLKVDLRLHSVPTQHLPVLSISLAALLSLLHISDYTQLVLLACGILIGWSYLRFYQPRGKGMRGDMSEAFDAASFFPESIRPVVRGISAVLFRGFVLLGVCKNPVRTYDVGAPSSITISLPGTDPVDAERRRRKALRALNERLTSMQNKNGSDDQIDDESWPTIDTVASPTEHSPEKLPELDSQANSAYTGSEGGDSVASIAYSATRSATPPYGATQSPTPPRCSTPNNEHHINLESVEPGA